MANIADLLPCAGQGEKRSGIMVTSILPPSFSFPAPCDCYDDIILPIGFFASMSRTIAKTIIKKFPRLAKPFRIAKASDLRTESIIEMRGWRSYMDWVVMQINNRKGLLIDAEFQRRIDSDNWTRCINQAGFKIRDGYTPPHCEVWRRIFEDSSKTVDELRAQIKELENLLKVGKNGRTPAQHYLGWVGKKNEAEAIIKRADDSIAWADQADALLSSHYVNYAVQLVDFGLTLIGLFSFVQKHKCEEEYMLNQTTCKCTNCDNEQGMFLCNAPPRMFDLPTWFPQLPGDRVGDERNTCVECCGGSVLVQDSIIEGGDCRCECPPGMIKRPCKKKPEGKGCNPLLPFSGGLDCIDVCGNNRNDGQEAGVCALENPPAGLVWSDVECDFEDGCSGNRKCRVFEGNPCTWALPVGVDDWNIVPTWSNPDDYSCPDGFIKSQAYGGHYECSKCLPCRDGFSRGTLNGWVPWTNELGYPYSCDCGGSADCYGDYPANGPCLEIAPYGQPACANPPSWVPNGWEYSAFCFCEPEQQ